MRNTWNYQNDLVVQVKAFGASPTSLSIQTELSTATFKQALRSAWEALRFRAPQIATKLVAAGETFEFEYVSPNAKELDEWAAITLLEKPASSSSQELVTALVNDSEELLKS